MDTKMTKDEAMEALQSIKTRMENLEMAFKTPMEIGMRLRGMRNALKEMPVELQECIDALSQ